jgi:hypothetical protein
MDTNHDLSTIPRHKKKGKRNKGFYQFNAFFIIVNSGLFLLNLKYSSGHLWFFYPFIGWGLGVFFHAMKVLILIFLIRIGKRERFKNLWSKKI